MIPTRKISLTFEVATTAHPLRAEYNAAFRSNTLRDLVTLS